ncbi:MAG: hypothetical protein JST92_08930 [Deltaproteobacteria bacterium]|nr:hypothetical protein [Deltaproteobacteria bacterium]
MRHFLPLAALLLAPAAFAADKLECTVDGAAFKATKTTAGVVTNEQLMGPGRWLSVKLENDQGAAIGLVTNWDKLEAAKFDGSGKSQEGASAQFQATWRSSKTGSPHILGPWKAKVEKLGGSPAQASFEVELEMKDMMAMMKKKDAPVVKVTCKGAVTPVMDAK